ncbi:carbamoyltransferase C-terminal domain-containing protein [Moorena producens]|uniref:carbamoyltransferase C-terminal domain-containing protein n=1 Tax=Moorena producens TaxID=1155739 RepID=UPI003C712956
MKILSFKPGHDGSIVYLNEGYLVFSLEGEKNSFRRYSAVTVNLFEEAMSYVDDIPDVVAVGGWYKGVGPLDNVSTVSDAGYDGLDNIMSEDSTFLGKNIKRFSSSHERSHLMCSYGMSPFEQGKPCYALVWEGVQGNFYKIDENINITSFGRVLEEPGSRYSFPYCVADNSSLGGSTGGRFLSAAGKMMALAAFSDHSSPNDEEMEFINFIMNYPGKIWKLTDQDLAWSSFLNIGVEHPRFKNLAGKISDRIFDDFYKFAKDNLTEGLPLLISGGCGLNCDWNTQWKNCGLFPEVFVPPCTNDSGSAIGTAVDAQFYYFGNAKISWDVYSGTEFIEDINCDGMFEIYDLNYDQVAKFIYEDNVIAWVQGKYEIGPRALGNRSLLASPLKGEMRDRLNQIKKREGYRPIAPVCLEEDVSEHFNWSAPSPYMLYFQKLRTDQLKAVTHVDNTARVQTVNSSQNPRLHELLTTFKRLSGFGVMCNTSLNFLGTGFINEMSDLVYYVQQQGLDGFVVNNKFYIAR